MELTSKQSHNHHLACLSGLSQAPLLATNNENGSERSTPISVQSPSNGSPSKVMLPQPSCSTPLTSATRLQTASVFFPPVTGKPSCQQQQQQLHFSTHLHSPNRIDINMNTDQEFNREAKRVSPASTSATNTFSGFFPPFRPKPISASAISNQNQKQWPAHDENYHLYHEPVDPDDDAKDPTPPPLTPRAIGSSSTSFADRASGSGRRNDVSADIYFCYVTLKNNERSNNRSRSYHGPKNSSTHNRGLPTTQAIEGATKNLSSASISELPASPTKLTPTKSMLPVHLRDHCVRELIETESNYVHALEMIINCFAKPLEGLLKRDDSQLIFGHIRYLHNIHSTFQADLVKAAVRCFNRDVNNLPSSKGASLETTSNPPTPTLAPHFMANTPSANSSGHGITISSCFLNAKDKFLKYGEYCASLSRAQSLLDELTNKNEAISTQLDHCQQEANEGKFKLRDLLSLPMQRILKYHLILAQLIKNTSSSNEDYVGLKRAHETMVDLGQYINEVKRDTEAIQIINEIEQSVNGLNMPLNTQLKDYGRLVADGFVRVRVPSDTKSKPLHETKLNKQKRYVFVFDKVILMCKVSGVRGYQYKEAIVLSEYNLDPNPILTQSEIGAKMATKEKWSYQFNLMRISDKATYCMYAKTADIKSKWVAAIQKAMDNTKPYVCRNHETNHEFLMHTFDKPTSCSHCGRLLLGLLYQGYRCATCFFIAHKKCLGSVRPCGHLMSHRSSKLPPSPSVQSNCSDDSRNVFGHLPATNSSSTPCVDVVSKNEYSNFRDKEPIGANLSFRENGSRSMTANQRPVSSMTDVSLQKSNNHLNSNDVVNSYVNFVLDEHPWFCGRMERDKAQALLEKMSPGTFLVRVSPRPNGSYVISLNYNNQVKHMRIYVSKDNQLYLSENRYFNSVIELVSWYERNSLVESFHMLDARLSIPFKAG